MPLAPPDYGDDPQRLADAPPRVLQSLAEREPRAKVRGWLLDLSHAYSAGRRFALARLIVESANAPADRKTRRD